MQLSVNQTDLPGNQFRVLMSTLNYCNHRSKVLLAKHCEISVPPCNYKTCLKAAFDFLYKTVNMLFFSWEYKFD